MKVGVLEKEVKKTMRLPHVVVRVRVVKTVKVNLVK